MDTAGDQTEKLRENEDSARPFRPSKQCQNKKLDMSKRKNKKEAPYDKYFYFYNQAIYLNKDPSDNRVL